MAANPNDGLLKKIKYMEENGVPLEEQLDVAAEELNYRVRNNLSASYKIVHGISLRWLLKRFLRQARKF